MAKLLCPHCGAPMGDFSDLNIQAAKLSGLQLRILEVLAEGRNRFIPTDRIIDIVYQDDATGGPESAKKVVEVSISKLRKKLSNIDVGIENRASLGYRLIKLDELAGAQ